MSVDDTFFFFNSQSSETIWDYIINKHKYNVYTICSNNAYWYHSFNLLDYQYCFERDFKVSSCLCFVFVHDSGKFLFCGNRCEHVTKQKNISNFLYMSTILISFCVIKVKTLKFWLIGVNIFKYVSILDMSQQKCYTTPFERGFF